MKTHSFPVVSERGVAQRRTARSRRLLVVLAFGLGLILAVVWLLGGGLPLALAANTTVNTTADELNSDSDCSLREAIQAANLGATVSGCVGDAGPDTISLPAGVYTLTLTGAEDANSTGDLDITSAQPITIMGVGAAQTIIDANGIDRVLDIRPGAGTVVISGVTIFNGNAGAVSQGGGICDAGAGLMLVNTVVLSNTASSGGGVYVGSAAAFTQTGVSVIARNAAGSGGGVYIRGSAALSSGQIVSNTVPQYGGGVYIQSGRVTLSGGQIASNTAQFGGGVSVYGGGAFTQTGASTITLNTATNSGGGVYAQGS